MAVKSQLGMCILPRDGMPIQVTESWPCALSTRVVVVEYRQEVLVGQAEHFVDFFRAVDQVKAELLRIAPVRDAIEAAVQIGVADHEPGRRISPGRRGSVPRYCGSIRCRG